MPRHADPNASFDFTPEPWVQDAACRGLSQHDRELFFGPLQEAGAQRYCAICPVTWQCFGYAVRLNMAEGLWGGVPQWDRRTLLRNGRWELDHFLQIAHAKYVTELRRKARKSA